MAPRMTLRDGRLEDGSIGHPPREGARIASFWRSRLARRIIAFNLATLGLLLAAVLVLDPTRDVLIAQREDAIGMQARLIAGVMRDTGAVDGLPVMQGQQLVVTDGAGRILRQGWGAPPARIEGLVAGIQRLFVAECGWIEASTSLADGGRVTVRESLSGVEGTVTRNRQRLVNIFAAILPVSIALSLALASMIARPLRDLTAAAEDGPEPRTPGRISIPDMTGRTDEIGRLSTALRGMVSALYDRIDANEQFAADVAHEIKNPLASLRSAVDTLRIARDDQRGTLLEVIDHDVRRLDRLVTDISNASRLDAELVQEGEEFDLIRTLATLAEHMGRQARDRGVDFVSDLPDHPVTIRGLEARLAQVFVNVIGNAMSFSEQGDTVRIWARKRAERVLVVVEDTGPGIPEDSLSKIFRRFYSERPADQFGNHSGLGLAISKQIVEAHGGVIWAENIRAASADPLSEPTGARFVIGLPA